ncbi:MAG: Bifunctional NAD(P)H-hydrate repair enzyme Nnr [Candidatus Heimdallarchaeota archaeon LC_2]|nr:MAG: Bifunctional NAD(P)H-hydrate repair enzyme Nnr [Candidatus Heimdallarchaeota archaeon LC_2]
MTFYSYLMVITMIPAITREGMIEVDRIMTEDLGIEIPLMMENAGLNLAKIAIKYYTKLQLKKIIIVSGSGNNGGGGMVAARRLKNWGFDVSLLLPKGMPSRSVPQAQLIRAQECGVAVIFQLPSYNTDSCLVVDSYIGYNFKGEIYGVTKDTIDWMRNQKLICLDLPSGVDSSTGLNPGLLQPLATVTLAFPKIGLQFMNPNHLGQIYLADVGVPFWVFDNAELYSGTKATNIDIHELANLFSMKSVFPIDVSDKGWSFTTLD